MLQADELVRHDAKHNPSGSSEESCFHTPLDRILHEAGIYLGSSTGLSSKFHSRNFQAERKGLVRRRILPIHAVGASWWLQSGCDTCERAHRHSQLHSPSARSAREAAEQHEDLHSQPHVPARVIPRAELQKSVACI